VNPWARWAVVALFAAAIFAASSTPRPAPAIARVPGLDKVLHFAVFFLFAASVQSALAGSGLSLVHAAAAAAAAAALYGASDEIHQMYVPGRCASRGDWAADAAGGIALAAAVLFRRSGRYRRKAP